MTHDRAHELLAEALNQLQKTLQGGSILKEAA
jgi:hypothetical protein